MAVSLGSRQYSYTGFILGRLCTTSRKNARRFKGQTPRDDVLESIILNFGKSDSEKSSSEDG
jgi:hypothetical protein